ncbi:LOW QUALITY PROTEIN: LIM domain-containing protein A [Lucilia sericata]|uniref:LOW QUALITY PROTEIN: LIM domain-containing protein A n=1 Tax=Lucilia sericata TaxID=13632 RepID=UPI0018A81446|nr:LOW QUALITY PROTEIN: LIM domain-containing protein A [Lucilia sericata]
MKAFAIIVTIVACAYAAPTAELQHPSPVNPNVLVEIKPEEKIILITDPKELAKFKRETKQPLYPTVLPGEHVHHRTKREVSQKPEEFQKPQVLSDILPAEVVAGEPKNSLQVETINNNNDNKKSQEDQEKDEQNITTEVYQKPQGLPAIFSPSNKAIQQQKRDIPVPLVAKHQHPEESPKETNEKETDKETHDDQKVKEVFQKPQGLPAIFSPATDGVQPQKRDIPVPLVPKYHHPEESPKESNEKEDHNNQKEVNLENHHVPQTLPAHNEDHVTTDGFQKPQPLPLILKDNHEDNQHKRDIPVPLVPKYHHPEESPKESNEKEDHDNRKEVNLEIHHVAQTLPAQNNDHVTAEGFQKPQTLPLILNDNHEDNQHKRDIPVPLVPKYHHPEESPKESNENHDNNKQVNLEIHHVPQSLPAHNEDHVTTEGFQKPQTLPLILKETPEETQHKRDIPVPLVPKYHHPEESPKESNEKEYHEEKENVKTENHNVPQTLEAHNQDHVLTEGLQKPQTLPFNLKETSEDTKQNKRDIPVPLVPKYHHPEESPKECNEKEINNENHVPLILPAHHQDHVIIESNQKAQTLQETPEDSKQNKRDIPVPLVPKHHHPEESIKENNEKESPENKKEVNLKKPQQPQTAAKESNEDPQQQKRDVLETKGGSSNDNSNEKKPHEENSQQHHVPQIHHIAQTLPNYQHEQHANFEAIHRPQFLIKHQEHHNDNDKSEDDVKPHHISQTLPAHIHKHLAAEGLPKSQILPAHNQEHIISTAALTHLPAHFHPEDLKKPQTLPAVTLQQKSDISAPVVSHQHEEEKKATEDHHPNKHEVQVEDLSESKPFQQPIHHVLSMQGDHKPNILDDHLSSHDSTTSTTTVNPILRHRPVPVAELFARTHGN